MNRDIKFRLWDKHNKMFFEPYSIALKTYHEGIKQWHDSHYFLHNSIDPRDSILQQYTGIKDKNGKEIYEGDIVKIKAFDKEHITDVKFKDGMFGIQWLDYTTTSAILKIVDWFDSIEVLGNIYENPELLK